jgi:hypothetical protein
MCESLSELLWDFRGWKRWSRELEGDEGACVRMVWEGFWRRNGREGPNKKLLPTNRNGFDGTRQALGV